MPLYRGQVRIAHAGIGATLLEAGWLSRHAAADAMGCTVAQLDRLAREGAIRCKSITAGVRLYKVTGRSS